MDIFGAIEASCWGLARRRRIFSPELCSRAANLVLRIAPGCPGALRAAQDPARQRAAGAGKARRRRNGAKTIFLNTRLLALTYLRYIVAGEIAGDWGNFGCAGALRIWHVY